MDRAQFSQDAENTWHIEPFGKMHVPAILYASPALIDAMDQKVFEQITNVASLPGIVKAAYAMPDAHWGYGFPIGGVAAFDPDADGVISAGGVGFDISCGVRTLHTGLKRDQILPVQRRLADTLLHHHPRRASAAPALCASTAKRWTPCSKAAPAGRWSKVTEGPRICSTWKNTAV
jgi:tRNA-splicing ligase RtcB